MSVCHKVKPTEAARTAIGVIRALDHGSSADKREPVHIPKGLVALGRKVVIALDHSERPSRIVKVYVTSDERRAGGEGNSDEGKEGEVFHTCGWMSKENWMVFVQVFCNATNLSLYSFKDCNTLPEKESGTSGGR